MKLKLSTTGTTKNTRTTETVDLYSITSSLFISLVGTIDSMYIFYTAPCLVVLLLLSLDSYWLVEQKEVLVNYTEKTNRLVISRVFLHSHTNDYVPYLQQGSFFRALRYSRGGILL